MAAGLARQVEVELCEVHIAARERLSAAAVSASSAPVGLCMCVEWKGQLDLDAVLIFVYQK